MRISKSKQAILRCIALSLPILLAAFAGVSYGQTTGPTQPDNTKVNQRDRDPNEATADRQKMNASDRRLTTTIRQSIIADKSLSTYAHNIKVISQNGAVTLKGPVRSEDEHKSILAKATAACGGADKVHDEISVKP